VIPDDKIIEIRERADIVEIIGEYVSLKRAGGNFKGVCPFHADSDPSFNVNPARHFFHCFGCGASGDVFSFVQRVDGVDFQDAARRLAARYGVEIPERRTTPEERREHDREKDEKNRRFFVLETATAFYERELWSPRGQAGRDLLRARGVDENTARAFRLGFAPDGWQNLIDHFRRERISIDEALSCGLVKPRSGGSGHYDLFRNRLVFPIVDAAGRPIAFSGRVMPGNESDAKYINSPETREYVKGQVLFGLHPARVALSKSRTAILVEGNFDVVSMHGAGFDNALAPMGTAFTDEQALLLRRRVDRVIVMFDGDRAGMTAATRAFPVLARAGLAAYMAPLPPGEDPDSLIRRSGKKRVEEIIERAKGLLDEIIRMAADATDGSGQDKARRIGSLQPFISAVKDGMERDLYRQKVVAVFGVEPSMVFRYLRDGRSGEEPAPSKRPTGLPLPGYVDERELIGLLVDLPGLCERAVETGAVALIRTPELRTMADQIVENNRHHSSATAGLLGDAQTNPVAAWLAKRGLERLFTDEELGKAALDEIRLQMEKREVEVRIADIDKQIQKAQGDDLKVLTLERQKTELRRELMAQA